MKSTHNQKIFLEILIKLLRLDLMYVAVTGKSNENLNLRINKSKK